jgi:hypothetical protein
LGRLTWKTRDPEMREEKGEVGKRNEGRDTRRKRTRS